MRVSVSLLLVAMAAVVMATERKLQKQPQQESRQFKQLASLKERLRHYFKLPSVARRPVWDRLNNGIRRQGIAGLLALLGGLGAIDAKEDPDIKGEASVALHDKVHDYSSIELMQEGPVAGVAVAVVVTVVVVATVSAVTSQQNASARGLDSDEWEINHSVWMEQLQKDFEDSWDTT